LTGEDERLIVAALDRLIQTEFVALRREMEFTNASAEKAVALASQESKARLEAHNGLIEQMRNQSAHFATREIVDLNRETYMRRFERIERWQSQMTGALLLISLAIPLVTAYLVHLLS